MQRILTYCLPRNCHEVFISLRKSWSCLLRGKKCRIQSESASPKSRGKARLCRALQIQLLPHSSKDASMSLLKAFPWPRIECFNCFISLLSVIKYQYQRRSLRNYVTFVTRKWNNFIKTGTYIMYYLQSPQYPSRRRRRLKSRVDNSFFRLSINYHQMIWY